MKRDRRRRYLRFFGPNIEADVDDELEFHLEMRIQDYESRGLSRADAERAARERFGDLVSVQESLREHDQREVRHHHRKEHMHDLLADLRVTLRGLRNAPAFTLVAVATLALGIGANAAVFSVVDAVIIRALPYRNPAALVSISGNTLAEATRIGELNRSFSDVAAYNLGSAGVSGDGPAERVDVSRVSPSLFTVLGAAPTRGRTFSLDADQPGHGAVAVLSTALADERFGGAAKAVGSTIDIDGAPYAVIGVMPDAFRFPTRDTRLWLPVQLPPSRSGAFWGSGGYRLIARLKAGVSPLQSQQELRSLFKQIRFENPIWDPGPAYGDDAKATPLQQQLAGPSRTMLLLLLGVVTLVLLIACANVANLLLVRGTTRRREMAIRAALGGGRARLVRLGLTESLVLAVAGAAVGLVVAYAGMHALVALLPADTPRVTDVRLDLRVVAFSTIVAAITGLIFGLLPALRASAVSAGAALQGAARAGTSRSQRRLTSVFVCAEIAAAVVLVAGAILLVRSMSALQRIDPGFRIASITTARVDLPASKYADVASVNRFYAQLLQQTRALPLVDAAGAVSEVPLTGQWGGAWRIAGQFEDIRHNVPTIDHFAIAAPDYFTTIGIPLLQGRNFSTTDDGNAPPVAIVSESFANRFWPHGNAIGQRIGHPWDSPWITIVGVVRDAKLDSLTGTSEQTIYQPLGQSAATSMSLVVRTRGDAQLAAALRQIVAGIDASVPVSGVRTMSDVAAASEARPRFTMLLLGVFAALAVTLGVVGIYGVMSYGVAQRTREIGLRMALGATPASARRMVLVDGLRLTGLGIALGLAGAVISLRLLAGYLVGVGPHDPVTLIAAPLVLALVAIAASYLPARRATRVDPAIALRAD